jgi:hypothetical protein
METYSMSEIILPQTYLDNISHALKTERSGRPMNPSETEFLCFAHDDHNPSANWNAVKGVWHCHACGAGGGAFDLGDFLGIPHPERQTSSDMAQTVYSYQDAHRKELFQTLRYFANGKKRFAQRQYNPSHPKAKPDGWLWKLEGIAPVLYHLPELLEAVQQDQTIFVTEGEKDVSTLERWGLAATTNPMGAGKWGDEYSEILRGADVVILPDNDTAGRDHCTKVLKSLEGKAKTIRVLDLPNLPEKGDVTDWKAQGGTLEQFKALLENAPSAAVWLERYGSKSQYLERSSNTGKQSSGSTANGGPASSLPKIIVNGRHLREISNDAVKALEAANNPPTLFQRGGELVRIAFDEDQIVAKPLDAVALKGTLDRVANFFAEKEKVKKGDDGEKVVSTDLTPARPPSDLAPDLLSRVHHLPFPNLRTLATSPIYSASGERISTSGFHLSSGIYLDLGSLEVPQIPSHLEGLALLRELLHDFPFISPLAGFAHTLTALLLPFVRPMIDGPTPLHLIEAPTRGSGKGLLSEVITHVSLGRDAGTMVKPKDGDEFEKRVTSALLEGAQVMLLDNVHTLEGEALAAALTARTWRGRLLGKSQMLTLPNDALWLATGNNPDLDDDMPRRIIPIRLDPQVERPEERTDFLHPDLLGWVKMRRGDLVAALMSLVEHWITSGRPAGTEKLGSYDSWTATMGGILSSVGVAGLLEGREHLYETANAEPQEWAEVLAEVFRVHQNTPVTAREFWVAMKNKECLSDLWEGRRELAAMQRIGHALRQKRDRVFGGFALRPAGEGKTQNKAYRVIRPERGGQKKTPETPKTPEREAKTQSSTTNTNTGVLSKTPPKTPPKTPENTPKTPVLTQNGSEVSSVSPLNLQNLSNGADSIPDQNTPKTPPYFEKHPPLSDSLQAVSDNVLEMASGVSGISGVFNGVLASDNLEIEAENEVMKI